MRIPDVGARTFALWRLSAAVADFAYSRSEKQITYSRIILRIFSLYPFRNKFRAQKTFASQIRAD